MKKILLLLVILVAGCQGQPRTKSPSFTMADVSRIEYEMTMDQVNAILGKPTSIETVPLPPGMEDITGGPMQFDHYVSSQEEIVVAYTAGKVSAVNVMEGGKGRNILPERKIHIKSDGTEEYVYPNGKNKL
jgi:hypothetical protein